MALVLSAVAQQQPQKSIAEVARENREARLRKAVEKAVAELCSQADDPKVQQTHPKIQEKCKDQPALVQTVFESTLKSLPEELRLLKLQVVNEMCADPRMKKSCDQDRAGLLSGNLQFSEGDKSWVGRAMAAQTAPLDSVAAAQARVDRVCKHDLSMTPTQITSTMADCDRAYSDLENAMRAQDAAQRSSPGVGRASAGRGDYLISLTGTPGLPVTGTCSFAGKSESYDDILPAQHVATAGRGVICSFVKK